MLKQVSGLGAIHKIPEWLSFWNEFIPSPYVSWAVFVYMIPKWHFVPIQVIQEWNSRCSGKKFHSLFQIVNHKSYSLWWVVLAYFIWCENYTSKYTLGWAVQCYHANSVQISFWNKTHSRIKLILVSYKQSLSHLKTGLWACKNETVTKSTC